MNNSLLGFRFETHFCEMLANEGFWVHRVSQNHGGQQPADVIAMKHGNAYLIDCKVCSQNDRFTLSRMEPNQRMAMDKWIACGGTWPRFALADSKGNVWMMDYVAACAAEGSGLKSVPCVKEPGLMVSLADWLEDIP